MWEIEIGPETIFIVTEHGETVLALSADQGEQAAVILDWHNDVWLTARKMDQTAARAA